jgi:hypothetical protein
MTACVGMATLAGAASAQAQMVYVEPPPRVYGGPPPAAMEGGLPASEILMVVRSSGLRPLTQPERRGPRYVLLASDNMGGQLRVLVSAHDGRIIRAEPAYDPRFAYHPVRPRGLIPVAPPQQQAAMPPHPAPELKEPTPPLPRNARTTAAPLPPAPATPNRLASAPDTTGSVPTRPARTPLPRPRPAIAANETTTAATTPASAPQAASPETSPEAETSAAARPTPTPAAPSAAPATKPSAETQMVPVAPLD